MTTYTKNFYNLYKRFIDSEIIIQTHQNESFPLTSIYFHIIRYLQLINMLSLSIDHYNVYVFQYVSILFSLSLLHRAWVNYTIMYCYNTSAVEFLMQGIKTVSYLAIGGLGFHTAQSVYFLPPNTLSNVYNIYSPTGRGYGAHTCSQLIAVDVLKSILGYDFNESEILDQQHMIDPRKLSNYWLKTRNSVLFETGEKILPNLKDVLKKSS